MSRVGLSQRARALSLAPGEEREEYHGDSDAAALREVRPRGLRERRASLEGSGVHRKTSESPPPSGGPFTFAQVVFLALPAWCEYQGYRYHYDTEGGGVRFEGPNDCPGRYTWRLSAPQSTAPYDGWRHAEDCSCCFCESSALSLDWSPFALGHRGFAHSPVSRDFEALRCRSRCKEVHT